MAISKRLLTKWRKEALQVKNLTVKDEAEEYIRMLNNRILGMTQELLDQKLLEEK